MPLVDEQRLDGIPVDSTLAALIPNIKAAAIHGHDLTVAAVDLHRPARDSSEEVAGISLAPIDLHALTVPEETA